MKLFTVVLGATTNVQKNYQVFGVQKRFGHMTMQPLYSPVGCESGRVQNPTREEFMWYTVLVSVVVLLLTTHLKCYCVRIMCLRKCS